MRIISGRWRGLNLAEFKGEDIRPTADRVKESLFNILAAQVAEAKVLDLFCGSGSLGIECLSRGAKEVHFNDISPDSIALLKKNLARLKGEADYSITISDYAGCLNRLAGQFDLIFIDPPYRLDIGRRALEIIAERDLLCEGGVAVYERDRAFEGEVEGLQLFDERKYGITFLSFFERKR